MSKVLEKNLPRLPGLFRLSVRANCPLPGKEGAPQPSHNWTMSSKLLNYPAATSNPHLASGTGPSSGGSSTAGSATTAGQLNLENLQLDDILCTVCQSVLVEPVFLPCQHRFCRNCLSGTIEKNNLNCPCCRKRFGTWYRNASRVNKLVHEQLWSAIQRQFREYLEEDGGGSGRCNGDGGGTAGGNGIVTSCFVPPTESVIHLSEPGEIRKEYENELQRYRKELIEEKKKELAASEKYIINLYKQEGIIDLVDSSDHLSISSSTSTPEPAPDQPDKAATTTTTKSKNGSGDVHEVDDDEEAGPSGSFPIRNGTTTTTTATGTSNNQSAANQKPSTTVVLNPVASRPGTSKSGSIISISSTSTASGASSSCISSASSRYSLSKSQQVDKTGQKAAASHSKQQAGGTAGVKKVFTMAEVNKSELCIKPTKIHRQTSSQAGADDEEEDADDGDSLRSELNHFKPILATTPKSCFSPKAIVRVPSVRPEAGTLPTSSSKTTGPTSPFKPIDPTTPRRSAFSVVNVHLFTPPTTTAGTSKKQPEAVANNAKKSDSTSPKKRSSAKKGSSSSRKKSKSTPATASRRKRKLKFSPTTTKVAKAKSSPVKAAVEPPAEVAASAPRVTRRSFNKEANRLKELIVSDQQRREAMIEQERRDFEFAQKLQKKFNRTRGAAGVTMAPEVIAKELLKQAQTSMPPPRRHSISYSLRRRPSVMEIPMALTVPQAAVEPQPSTSFAVPEVPATSRKRKTMAAPPLPAALPHQQPQQPTTTNRKKPTKPAAAKVPPIKVEPEPEPPAKILRRSTRNRN